MPSSKPPGFSQNPSQLRSLVDQVLEEARAVGATDAAAVVSEGYGLGVTVRMGELESVERHRDRSLGVTVYIGQRRGDATTSDFSVAALRQAVRAAYDIASHAAEDPVGGLPDAQDLATAPPELDLFHAWDIQAEQAAVIAQRCEDAARAVDRQITNSEGASVSADHSQFYLGTSQGFHGGYPSSRHAIAVSPIAGRGDGMQRDDWYTSTRHPADLAAPEVVGQYAAQRALSRLGARKISTRECPVLFESTLAAGLVGSLVQALSGGSLYRRASFLLDSLGQAVLPAHVDLDEDPHVRGGRSSAPFDDEGVRTQARRVIDGGVVQGYFLSSYTARKLDLRTTGHAGGSHNLRLSSRLTTPGDDLEAMLRRLDRGLFVTDLMGQGVNLVTGDYSRGASGFWVEKGRIAYPVHEITIAGHLPAMLKDVVAVGADEYTRGGKTIGSVLIGRMKVAGH